MVDTLMLRTVISVYRNRKDTFMVHWLENTIRKTDASVYIILYIYCLFLLPKHYYVHATADTGFLGSRTKQTTGVPWCIRQKLIHLEATHKYVQYPSMFLVVVAFSFFNYTFSWSFKGYIIS